MFTDHSQYMQSIAISDITMFSGERIIPTNVMEAQVT